MPINICFKINGAFVIVQHISSGRSFKKLGGILILHVVVYLVCVCVCVRVVVLALEVNMRYYTHPQSYDASWLDYTRMELHTPLCFMSYIESHEYCINATQTFTAQGHHGLVLQFSCTRGCIMVVA